MAGQAATLNSPAETARERVSPPIGLSTWSSFRLGLCHNHLFLKSKLWVSATLDIHHSNHSQPLHHDFSTTPILAPRRPLPLPRRPPARPLARRAIPLLHLWRPHRPEGSGLRRGPVQWDGRRGVFGRAE